MTFDEIETALDAGQLQISYDHGSWLSVRRNGRTKLWKRDVDRFNIPCKLGFNTTFCIASSYREASCFPCFTPRMFDKFRVKPA